MSKGLGRRQLALMAAVKLSGGMYVNDLLTNATEAQRQATYRAINGLTDRGLLGRAYWCYFCHRTDGRLWIFDPTRPNLAQAPCRKW